LFSDYSEGWIKRILPCMKKASRASVRSRLGTAAKYLENKTLAEVADQTVAQDIALRIARDWLPQTTHNIWGAIRMVLATAAKEKLIAEVPTPRLSRIVRKIVDCKLRPDQMKKLIDASEGRDKALHALLCETGVRIGEALALTPASLDTYQNEDGSVWNRLTISQSVNDGEIQAPKTNSSIRRFTISGALRNLLDPLSANKYLFCTQRGTPLYPKSTIKALKHSCLRATIPEVSHHDLRGASCNLWYGSGCPEPLIQMRLGHAMIGVTRLHYYGWDHEEEQRCLAKVVEKLYGGGQ
jgi:integrase